MCKLQNFVKYTGCIKINETHKIADKYVDFNPIFLYFSDLIAVINNNYYFKTPWLGNKKKKCFASQLIYRLNLIRLFKHASAGILISTLILENPRYSCGIVTFKAMEL